MAEANPLYRLSKHHAIAAYSLRSAAIGSTPAAQSAGKSPATESAGTIISLAQNLTNDPSSPKEVGGFALEVEIEAFA